VTHESASYSYNISYSLQVLTGKGVSERKARDAVTHAKNEKLRRQELLDCFHKLGSTFLSEEECCIINKYTILDLVIIKMIIPYLY
jgi:hypothetical protein